MTGAFSIVIPEAGTNLLTNPSLETGTTGFAVSGASTIARSTLYALFGAASLSIVTTGAGTEGAQSTVDVTADLTYTASVYVRGEGSVRVRLLELTAASAVLTTFSGTVTTLDPDVWQRLTVSGTFGATGVKARVQVVTSPAQLTTFYADGWQLEQADTATTYMDGDQAGCTWTGTAHASTTTRSVQSRAGGRVRNLDDYNAYVEMPSGLGMPPVNNIASDYGLLPGQLHQRTVAQARVFTLATWLSGTSLSNLHSLRRALLDAIKPDLVTPVQPFLLRYTGSATEVEIACRYDAGMELPGRNTFQETIALRLVADDPYFYGIGTEALALAYNTSLASANRIVERNVSGVWGNMAAGAAAGTVLCAVYGPDNTLYVGGTFTTIGGVAANRIAKWNGTAWSALGTGLNGACNAITFDAAGTLYAGGAFTTAGGAAANFIATWNGAAWAALSPNTGTGTVNALAFDSGGVLYVGGNFTNWAGIADGDYIVRYLLGYLAMGTGGVGGAVNALAVDSTGASLYAGGDFTSMGGVANTLRIAKWTVYGPAASAWTALGTGLNNTVNAFTFDTFNTLYVGGAFTDAGYPYLTWWNGTVFNLVGLGIAGGAVTGMQRDRDGSLVIGGAFTSAGGSTANANLTRWNGAAFLPLDIDLPGTPTTVKPAISPVDGRMALLFDTTGTAATSSTAALTASANAGTAEAAPIFIITGPGTLEGISNWSTVKHLYFSNLTLQAGERAILDLTPGAPRFFSTIRANLMSTILPSSDVSAFRIQSGINILAVKMTGTTAATAISATFRKKYWSADS